ncbi:MAG: DUF4352 domain-containing protein [Actinobacteria bacterium]|nr:DUF4352 domain-containing protein [Actinomycetota bacterium]
MRKTWLALVGAALLLTGCAGTPTPAPTVTVFVTQTVTPSPSAEPTPAGSGPLALGTPAKFGGVSVTVHAVNLDPTPEPAPQPQRPEDKWVAADVEVCSDKANTVSTSPWEISDSTHRRFRPSSTGYAQFLQPSYAVGEEQVAAGSCRRGWITFDVTKDAQLTTVEYANSAGYAASWVIS